MGRGFYTFRIAVLKIHIYDLQKHVSRRHTQTLKHTPTLHLDAVKRKVSKKYNDNNNNNNKPNLNSTIKAAAKFTEELNQSNENSETIQANVHMT